MNDYRKIRFDQDMRDGRISTHPVCENLYLRVTGKNKAIWSFRYQIDGARRMVSLGDYNLIDFDQAKGKASELMLSVKAGKDPFPQNKPDKKVELSDVYMMAVNILTRLEPVLRNEIMRELEAHKHAA